MYRLYRSLGCWPKEEGKTQRARVHLFDCESLHRNKVTEKKRDVKPDRKRKERNERKRKAERHCQKQKKNRGRGVNSTSIARFHRRLPHHLHREHQQKERKGIEIINQRGQRFHCPQKQWPPAVRRSCSTIVFIHLSYQRGRERKHRKRDKKKGRKRRKNEKKKRNHKPAGTAFRSLLSFFAYKICKTGKKKVQKTRRKREERRLQRWSSEEERQKRIGGKSWSRGNTDRLASKPSNIAVVLSFPGLFSSPPAPCIFLLCVCTVQVNFNSLEQ